MQNIESNFSMNTCVSQSSLEIDLQSNRFLRIKEVCSQVGLRPSTIYKKINEGKFPVQRHNGKTIFWLQSDINTYKQNVLMLDSQAKANRYFGNERQGLIENIKSLETRNNYRFTSEVLNEAI